MKIAVVALGLLIPTFSVAESKHGKHKAHTHGEAAGALVIDGSQVMLELTIPWESLVAGSEKRKISEATIKKMDETKRALRSFGEVASLDGDCTLDRESGDRKKAGKDHHDEKHHGKDHHDEKHHGKDHHDEKHHGKDHHGDEHHSDLTLVFKGKCKGKPTNISLKLFETYQGLASVKLTILKEQSQQRQVLTKAKPGAPI